MKPIPRLLASHPAPDRRGLKIRMSGASGFFALPARIMGLEAVWQPRAVLPEKVWYGL